MAALAPPHQRHPRRPSPQRPMRVTSPLHHRPTRIRRHPILSKTNFTRTSTLSLPTFLSPTPQSFIYHQQCDTLFLRATSYFNLSGLGYLIESFQWLFVVLFPWPHPPHSTGKGEHPTFAYTSRKILCICFSFSSSLVLLLSCLAGGRAGMDLHEPFFIFL
jgi:hypothetical protein